MSSDSCSGCLVTNDGHPSSWRHSHVRVSGVSGCPHKANRRAEYGGGHLISRNVQQTTTTLPESWCPLHHGISAHLRVSCASSSERASRWLLSTSSLIPIDRNAVTTPPLNLSLLSLVCQLPHAIRSNPAPNPLFLSPLFAILSSTLPYPSASQITVLLEFIQRHSEWTGQWISSRNFSP